MVENEGVAMRTEGPDLLIPADSPTVCQNPCQREVDRRYQMKSRSPNQDDPLSEMTTNVLMQELAQIREDDRSALVQISAIMGVALALLVVVTELAIYFKHSLPWPVYLSAPVVPSVLITYVLLLGSNASVRTYYARTLEFHLAKRIHQPDSHGLYFPSWSHFEARLNGANAIAPMALNWLLVYLGCLFIVLSWMVFVIFTQLVGWHLKVVAVVIDSTLLFPPILLAILNTTSGRQRWHELKDVIRGSFEKKSDDFPLPGSSPKERSLIGFILLPRYEDLVKGILMPITFGVFGFMMHLHLSWSQTIRPAIGVWLVFELVIYQARYLVNDVRGRIEDNSTSTLKRRFPSKYLYNPDVPGSETLEKFAVRLCFWSLIVRLVIGTTLFMTFAPPRYYVWLICLMFLTGFTLITPIYELARHLTDGVFDEITEKGDDPQKTANSKKLTLASYSVVGLVGIGYAIRALLALWLLGGFPWNVQLLLGVFALSFGSMFVYMTWILESTKTSVADFTSKAHLLLLGYPYRVRFSCNPDDRREVNDACQSDAILSIRQSPFSALTLLGVVSQMTMLLLVRTLLFGSTDNGRWVVLLVTGIVMMVAVMIMPTKFTRSKPLPAFLFAIIALAVSEFLLADYGISLPQRVAALIALGISPVTALFFRGSCDDDIEDSLYNYFQKIRPHFAKVPKWFDSPAKSS